MSLGLVFHRQGPMIKKSHTLDSLKKGTLGLKPCLDRSKIQCLYQIWGLVAGALVFSSFAIYYTLYYSSVMTPNFKIYSDSSYSSAVYNVYYIISILLNNFLICNFYKINSI